MTQTQRIHPFSQLMILVGLFGAGLVIGIMTSVILAKIIFGIPALSFSNALKDPANVQMLRFISGLNSLLPFGLPALIFALIFTRKPFANLGFYNFNLKQIFFVALLFLASIFIVGALAELNQIIPLSKSLEVFFRELENKFNEEVMAIAHMNTTADFLFSLLILCLLPAIFEEMFFRGAMQPIFIRWTKNAFAGILITSMIFSLLHFSYYGFLPRLFLGLLLGYIYWYGKSLWLNITLHFLNNVLAVTEMFMLNKQGKLNAESMNDTFPLYYGLLGIIAVLALFVVFKKESERLFAERAARLEENVFKEY